MNCLNAQTQEAKNKQVLRRILDQAFFPRQICQITLYLGLGC